MGEIFKLFGTIGVDNGEANKALDETESKGQSTTSKLVGFFKKAALAIGAAFAVEKIINFGKLGVEAAASAQALNAQFTQVFGKLEPLAQRTVESMGKKMNILPNRIKPTFSRITSMFKGLGLDTEAAMKKSEQATTLAADAAAFYDVSLEDASGSLTSFLKGNYEAGEAIGIFANDTQMAQFAISQGVVGSTKDWQNLDEATKQATRLDYANNMLKQAGAVGQAAREADGYENVMGNLKQAWQDFLAKIGTPILGTVVSIIQSITKSLSGLGDKVAAVIPDFGGFQKSAMDAFNSIQNSGFVMNLQWAFKWISDAIKNVAQVVQKEMPEIKGIFEDTGSQVSMIFTKLAGVFSTWSITFADIFTAVVPKAIEIFKSAFKTINTVVLPAIEKIVEVLWDISGAVSEVIVNDVIPAFDKFTNTISKNKTLFNSLKSVVVGVGAAFITYKGIMKGIKIAQEAYNTVMFASKLATKGLDAATIALGKAQGSSTLAFKLNVAAVKAAAVAQRIYNAALNANPFVLIISAVVALVAAVIYLWKTNDKFRKVVIDAWNAVKETALKVFKSVADFVKQTWDSIVKTASGLKDSLVKTWNDITAKVSEIWKKFTDAGKKTFDGFKKTVENVFNGVKNFLQTVWNVIYAVVGAIIVNTINIWKGIFDGFKAYFQYLWDLIKAIATGVWEKIGDTVMGIINGFIGVIKGIFDAFKNFFEQLWYTIANFVKSIWDGIKNTITSVATAIKNFVTPIFNAIKTTITNVFNAIKNTATNVWNTIKTTIINVAQAILNFVTPIFNTMKNTITNIFNAIRNTASSVWNSIKTTISNIVTAVKNTVTNIFNSLKNSITNIFNAIRNTASTVWNSIKSTVSNIVSAMVNIVKNLFNGMKNAVSSIWEGVKSVITNVVNAVKNTISNVWSGITGTVSNIFNGVKNAIDGPMNAAKNLVKGVVDAIKGFFNFNISWPKIPLPHFSISPAGWSAGDLLKGKIPSLGIEWYKDGGIMTQPTLFGMNGNNAMIGGEAGAEAVAPIDTLLGYVETAVRGVMAEQKDGDINVTQYITSPEPLTPREIARETKYKLQDLATLRK
ncbi:TPA: phage tail protein [Enterococcus faecalis]|nr:phage tail protein [Enterococcus faecalis]